MTFQHKIDRANILYDEIARIEFQYDVYEEIPRDEAIKIIRMHEIAFDMTVELIKQGAW